MSIKSYAEGIKYGIMDAKEASGTILDATNRLTDMVGDILYVSRIDNITTPHMDRVDLNAIIAERIHLHETPANKGMLRFDSVQPVWIPCVKSYVERALDNLISNALRYAGSRVDIECRTEGGYAEVCINDDGPGFEPAHVFERFYKGRNGLSGIGLSIVKSIIIDQHKGVATAENGKEGAILTISIPRRI
jgi:signal transduction histidine kinase